MATGPKPYPVVYDTDNGFQYIFETGNIQIPANGDSFPAVLALDDQAADIGVTTLFTTSTAGLYRVSFYGVCTASDGGAGSVTPSFHFTDPAGANGFMSSTGIDLTAVGSLMTGTYTFIATAASDVTYELSGGGTYGTATYSFSVTAEKLH